MNGQSKDEIVADLVAELQDLAAQRIPADAAAIRLKTSVVGEVGKLAARMVSPMG